MCCFCHKIFLFTNKGISKYRFPQIYFTLFILFPQIYFFILYRFPQIYRLALQEKKFCKSTDLRGFLFMPPLCIPSYTPFSSILATGGILQLYIVKSSSPLRQRTPILHGKGLQSCWAKDCNPPWRKSLKQHGRGLYLSTKSP